MRALVTGGAGFIGSHLVERLLREGVEVVVLDNFSSGRLDNLASVSGSPMLKVIKGDVRDYKAVREALRQVDVVFHLAANPEVRVGDPHEHFEHNIKATFTLLEAMRNEGVKDIVFASSSTVYGEASTLPTPEDYGPLKPISVYGASKLACEALISSYTHTYEFRGVALRYANVVGPRSRRGVVYDFVRKLLANPRRLVVLGDGTQTKSYIWVEDAVEATVTAWRRMGEGFEAYNVGSIDAIPVSRIAEIVIEEGGLKGVEIHYTGGVKGGRGWIGDVKKMHLSIEKLAKLGWRPKYNSEDAVRMAARHYWRLAREGLLEPMPGEG
ncbi:MAG: UDP-glucose 4-epimerase [Thermoprotei archaeon]|nr:MAG: UDP-glucose 4-epimerase [Thermoprotei archaeon]